MQRIPLSLGPGLEIEVGVYVHNTLHTVKKLFSYSEVDLGRYIAVVGSDLLCEWHIQGMSHQA